MSPPQIILFSYPESPFGQKLELVLLFKQLPYSICSVARMPPRPPLEALGVTYRRIPVLAIGNDLYLDTSLAVAALEKAFPKNPLASSEASWGVQLASSFFWSDRAIFRGAAGLLPWDKMPAAFVVDRGQYMGRPIEVEQMAKGRPMFLSAIRSHMALIETALESRTGSNAYILNTAIPTYLDLSLYFSLAWMQGFGTASSLYTEDQFPLLLNWIVAIRSAIVVAKKTAPNVGVPPKISSSDASRLIHAASPIVAKSDPKEPLLVSAGVGGWLKLGDKVEVAPNDTGMKPAQRGTLVGLDAQRVSIEVKVGGGSCRVHAPRLGFTVGVEKKASL